MPVAPRLTIAIPTVNRAALLVRAIDSALAQTAQGIEVIVSDNGSSDDTPAVIARYADRRLRTFRRATTVSAAEHGNFLLQQARGEFFLGLSDDDFLEPEFAAEVLGFIDRHPGVAFVYTGCAVHYDECAVPAAVGPELESGAAFLAGHYAGRREVIWCACVTRLADLRSLGPLPADCIIGDMYLWTRLAFRGPVGCVPRVLSNYVLLRTVNDNISHGTSPQAWAQEQRRLADQVLESSRRAGAEESYLVRLQADIARHIARSTANQFVWIRLRGATRRQVWRQLRPCRPYLSWYPLARARVAAALLLPRWVLSRLLRRMALSLARSRAVTTAVG